MESDVESGQPRRHSLLGLPLLLAHPDDAVRCPECGEIMVLGDIGLRYAELIPPPGS